MSQFDFIEQSSLGAGFVFKNPAAAYVYGVAHFVATTGTGTTILNISSVTDGIVVVGMTLTGLSSSVTIASFGTFNGTSGTVNLSAAVTWTNPTTVTAIGFIKITDTDYPATTVRGIAYLDGAYYVMTPGGTIYGSALNNPYTWTALNAIQTIAEPDTSVALFRQLNLIVAFNDYSIEYFYDAANPPPGSPLSPYTSAALEMGCACADSIAQAENTLYFMGKAKQKGRSIYKLVGTAPENLSNPYVDKILDSADLTEVASYVIKIQGHVLYFLTLKNDNITLVYDESTKMWNVWTQLAFSFSVLIQTMTWANGLVTVNLINHQIEDGSYISITGSAYAGNYVVNAPTADTITFQLAVNPGVYTSDTATLTAYTESFFNMASYIKVGSTDTVQDSTTGFVYALTNTAYLDNSLPIKYKIRTSKFDGGSNKFKFFKQLELIGDKESGVSYVRYSDDDYTTWSQFRPIQMNLDQSKLDRLGRSRRRAFEIINYENTPMRLESLELIVKEGIH